MKINWTPVYSLTDEGEPTDTLIGYTGVRAEPDPDGAEISINLVAVGEAREGVTWDISISGLSPDFHAAQCVVGWVLGSLTGLDRRMYARRRTV